MTPSSMKFKKHRMRGSIAEEVVDEMRLLDVAPLTKLIETPPPQNGFRDGDYIHVSDLINKCPRAIAIHYVHGRQLYGMNMSHQLGFTFRQGEAIASYMEDHVKRTAPEHMYGGWKCKCGSTEKKNTTFDKVSELKCKTCGSGLDNYIEVFIANDNYMISGSVDITLAFGDLFYVNELKSIKKDGSDGFVGLTQAKPLHRIQALFYMWLFINAGKRVHSKFSVFYVSKSFGFRMTDQIKEFQMNYSDYAQTLQPYLDDAKAIKDARAGGPLPARPCEDVYCQRAKSCELAPLCFNLSD